MENWCRLCANETITNEFRYSIDDDILNIKQMLIVCCRWDKIADEEQDIVDIPKMICKICFEKLEECWQFAENVMLAQQKIQMHTMEVKPTVLLQIEKVDLPSIAGEEGSLIKTEIHKYTEALSPIGNVEFDFDDSIEDDAPIDDCKSIDTKNFNLISIDENADIGCDLLALLRMEDKNPDGTVNEEKIAELKLDDWSILKSHCWICKTLFDKHRTFKAHFRTKHAGEVLRFYCTLCNVSTAKRNTLQNHMSKIHRPYLKFW